MRIGIVCGGQSWTRALAYHFIDIYPGDIEFLLTEEPGTASVLLSQLRSRLKRYGLIKTISQAALQFYLASKNPWGFIKSKHVTTQVREISFGNLNSPEAKKYIAGENIDILICMATSILNKDTIAAVNLFPINLHPGINPRYRGAGGNFWAIKEENWDRVGCTMHCIDTGIDTGRIIGYSFLDISHEHNTFEKVTYASLKAGLDHLSKILSTDQGISFAEKLDEPSRLYGWYGLLDYLEMNKALKKKVGSI